MDRNVSSFTVCFQPPFWVGIAERWTADGYEAARVVFGPEPSDAQIYQWLGVEWHKLRFSPAAPGERARVRPENPKRVRREARKTLESSGAGTRAQQALALSLIHICGLPKDSVVLLEQIRTLDKRRLREHMGRVDETMMKPVDTAIAVSFGLHPDTMV